MTIPNYPFYTNLTCTGAGHPLGRHTPPGQTPPWEYPNYPFCTNLTCTGADTHWADIHPLVRHPLGNILTILSALTWHALGQTPTRQTPPPGQTPPWEYPNYPFCTNLTCTGADTHWADIHPLVRHPLGNILTILSALTWHALGQTPTGQIYTPGLTPPLARHLPWVDTPGKTSPPRRSLEWAVRILLECILVLN